MNSTVSLVDYCSTLQKFYGFHVPLEEKLGQHIWAALNFDFEVRRKIALLEQDLPDLSSFSQAMGCLYVMEGSTLGGQIITRHLKKHLSLDHFHYFNSYGEEVGTLWENFAAFAAEYASTPQIEDQMVLAACETFIKLKGWLTT